MDALQHAHYCARQADHTARHPFNAARVASQRRGISSRGGTEHILLGLARESDGVAARILLDFDVTPEKIRNEVFRMLSGPGAAENVRAMAVSSRETLHVIDRGWLGGLGVVLDELGGEIRGELQRAPDIGDLLLALASAPDTLAGRALRELGADLDRLPAMSSGSGLGRWPRMNSPSKYRS
jgi:hypothetical protein